MNRTRIAARCHVRLVHRPLARRLRRHRPVRLGRQPSRAGAPAAATSSSPTATSLNVRVFNQEPLSTKERVRADGHISIPVIGEIVARGKRPAQLAAEIQDRLKDIVKVPSVIVTFEQGAELKVSVVGEVRNSGVFPIEPGSNVLHALAAAGGLTDYADADKVFVVRKSLPQRVRFRYADLRSHDPKSIEFTLQAGDVVVVE